MSCQDCIHVTGKSELSCHRFPPQVQWIVVPTQSAISQQMSMEVQKRSTFPLVQAEWICAEFKAKLMAS